MQQILAAAAAATEVGTLWDALTKYFDRVGVRYFSFLHFPSQGSDQGQSWARSRGLTDDFLARYWGGLYNHDPARLYAATAALPFRLSELGELITLLPEQKAFLDEVRVYGVFTNDLLIIPVFGPQGRNGYVAIELPSSLVEIPRDLQIEFQVVAQFAHQRFCEFVTAAANATAPLSPREQEVLGWVARGKSNSVIADIIGVSTNTVDTHLRRIYVKLDVCDRVSATLAGLGRGYISID